MHEVVDTPDELISRGAKQWVKDNPDARQPWDQKELQDPRRHAVDAVVRGEPAGVPGEPAQAAQERPDARRRTRSWTPRSRARRSTSTTPARSSRRYFAELACGQVSTNMTRAFFFDLQAINKGASRPEGYEKHTARKVGRARRRDDGRGIAYSCAHVGPRGRPQGRLAARIAEKGKDYSKKILDKAVSRGEVDPGEGRRGPRPDHARPPTPADAAGADLVIEAVFESPDLKKQVFAEIMPHLAPDAVLGSNTSTLPITGLARASTAPGGLHRPALLLAGRQDAAPGDHPRREDERRDAGQGRRHRAADQEDPDRRLRQPRVLHQPRHRHVHQRGRGDARRGRRAVVDRAGRRRRPATRPRRCS